MVVVVVECCSCIPVLTFAPSVVTFALCVLTLHLALVVLSFSQPAQIHHLHTWWWSLAATGGGVFSSAIGANIPCTSGGFTCCNLHWWSFSFHPLAHILEQLALCGGGIYI